MPRAVRDESRIHPAIRDRVAALNADIVREVADAVAANPVVVVGMGWNPWPRKARRLLDGAGIAHRDLSYGDYLRGWRRRNALKMWTGWPTFPMVFVAGQLVGGYTELKRLHDGGELRRLLG